MNATFNECLHQLSTLALDEPKMPEFSQTRSSSSTWSNTSALEPFISSDPEGTQSAPEAIVSIRIRNEMYRSHETLSDVGEDMQSNDEQSGECGKKRKRRSDMHSFDGHGKKRRKCSRMQNKIKIKRLKKKSLGYEADDETE